MNNSNFKAKHHMCNLSKQQMKIIPIALCISSNKPCCNCLANVNEVVKCTFSLETLEKVINALIATYA